MDSFIFPLSLDSSSLLSLSSLYIYGIAVYSIIRPLYNIKLLFLILKLLLLLIIYNVIIKETRYYIYIKLFKAIIIIIKVKLLIILKVNLNNKK